jgi:hypothetical protein
VICSRWTLEEICGTEFGVPGVIAPGEDAGLEVIAAKVPAGGEG